MGALAVFPERIASIPDAPTARVALDAADGRLVASLRRLARASRAAPRLDLHRACALLAHGSDEAADVYGMTLLRALDREAARTVVFHAGHNAAPSFDELWLLRILRLFQGGDEAGARFLIAGRVPMRSRRMIAFLAARFAEGLDSA